MGPDHHTQRLQLPNDYFYFHASGQHEALENELSGNLKTDFQEYFTYGRAIKMFRHHLWPSAI